MRKLTHPMLRGWALAILFPTALSAQQPAVSTPVSEQLANARHTIGQPYGSAPFSFVAGKNLHQPVPDAAMLELSLSDVRRLWADRPSYLMLNLPGTGQHAPFELELTLRSPLTKDFRVTTSSGQTEPYIPGNHYRGTLKGQPNTLVALSVFKDEVFGVIAMPDKGNLVLGRLNKPGNTTGYVLYADRKLHGSSKGCMTIGPSTYAEQVRQSLLEAETMGKVPGSKCVQVYLECGYGLYQEKGSVAAVTNFVTAIFNNVAVLYANESISTAVSEVHVWNTPDSYPGNDAKNALMAFRAARPSFNGDLALLADIDDPGAGGTAFLNGLCKDTSRYGYTNIENSLVTVPAYSWNAHVMTHEMGHILGSPHTHDCVWGALIPSALDNCEPSSVGSCEPRPTPTNGGTIMSYCHLTSHGVNFSNGFGMQPGYLVRDNINKAACLSLCESEDPYCRSGGHNSSFEFIQQVKLGNLDNNSGNNNGYADFTGMSVNLVPGDSVAAILTAGFVSVGGVQFGIWHIWIDYNHDNDFDDPGEKVGTGSSTPNSPVRTISFIVPATANGTTRMRISMRLGFGPYNPCDIHSYGEVEDYTVAFGDDGLRPPGSATALLPVQAATDDFNAFPNPAHSELNIRWSARAEETATLTLMDMTGRTVAEVTTDSRKGENTYVLPVDRLAPGHYLVRLQSGTHQYRQKIVVSR